MVGCTRHKFGPDRRLAWSRSVRGTQALSDPLIITARVSGLVRRQLSEDFGFREPVFQENLGEA